MLDRALCMARRVRWLINRARWTAGRERATARTVR
jgi:hypothetical protein